MVLSRGLLLCCGATKAVVPPSPAPYTSAWNTNVRHPLYQSPDNRRGLYSDIMPMVIGTVTVRLKEGVLDPQGVTIRRALEQMGYAGIENVRAGKTFEIRLEAPTTEAAKAQLKDMSEKLLANPVIETFDVEVQL